MIVHGRYFINSPFLSIVYVAFEPVKRYSLLRIWELIEVDFDGSIEFVLK